MNTITLPDGYNGHTVECDATPIEDDGNLLKLRVTGSPYLFRWVRRAEWEALTKETPTANPDEALRAWSNAYPNYIKVNHDATDTADQQAAREKVSAAIKTLVMTTTCQHPPHRLFSWHAGEVLCICCNDCGAVLQGGVE